MTPDTPFNTDYHIPGKPEPRIISTVHPDKKPSSINVWFRYIAIKTKKLLKNAA